MKESDSKLFENEERLTAFLKGMYPEYQYAVNLVAYWIAIAIESAPNPQNAYIQFTKNLDMYCKTIRNVKNGEYINEQ